MKNKQVMVFENGRAMPVFPFTDGTTEDYDAVTSDIVRYCVYIETDYDMDGDGKRDLVKAFVQVPRSAVEGNYKAATLYEPRPYCSGVNNNAYDHMKDVQNLDLPPFDLTQLDSNAEPRVPTGFMTTMEAALQSRHSEWYYTYAGDDTAAYQGIDLYDYFLVRGFAVVLSSGFGTYGSDGFEYVGSHYERDAFKAVVEWLHGDRIAYTDRTGTTAIRADWSNGNVAMTGRSYAGTMPFAVATTGVAGLKTIIPVAGIADWYSQQNMQGSQRYWPKEVLNSFLCYFCSSQYEQPGMTDEKRRKIDHFLHQISLEQLKGGCDYNDFWADGNYTLKADSIRCSALIIHGLNDENVSTKQFEMMLKSFQKAGMNAKLVLHQGQHITPAMPHKGYGIDINGQYYDEIVNEWISHYLYGLENGAENRPAVLVQSNVDQKEWFTADSWDTGIAMKIHGEGQKVTTVDSDWSAAGVTPENFDEKMSMTSSNMNQRWLTEALAAPLTIQGTVRVDFTAALSAGDPAEHFHPTNPNDADTLTMQIANAPGRMDDVKLCFLLCDVAEERFPNIATEDPQRNNIPFRTAVKGGFCVGGGLPDVDIWEFDTVNTPFKVITRAYIDLCNPESGYEPATAANSILLEKGAYHDYHVFLNATRYTLAAGHKLVLVITTEDPINCLIHKQYAVDIQDASLEVVVPVTEAYESELTFFKG